MSIFRSPFTKDTTISKGNYVNTGQNPVGVISYGSDFTNISRYIFDYDLSQLKTRINDFRIPSNGTIKHTLKLTNTLAYDKNLLGGKIFDATDHASSFDLVLFTVPQFWDEGVGYDYLYNNTILDINGKIYETSANWYQATDIVDWNEDGIYSGQTSQYYNPLATIHFDLGNEDISLDVTDFINTQLTGSTPFYGLGLAFTPQYEILKTQLLYSVGFFGKDTNTFFSPAIETEWKETILDDRKNFYYDKTNKLYLYTNVNKSPTNLDILPSAVTISDYNDDVVVVISGVTQESKGVYSINLELNSTDYDNVSLVNFTDTWSGLIISGKSLPDSQMSFTVKQNDYYNIGNEVYEPQHFTFNFSGIKRAEKILQGEVRKVIVTTREMYDYDTLIVNNIFYRIYVKQGLNQIEVVPKSVVNLAYNQNYFYLDTSWMVPQEYFMEIIVNSNGTVTKQHEINFIIIDSENSSINFDI